MADIKSLMNAVAAVQARQQFDPTDEQPQLVALGPMRMFALCCYAPHDVDDEEVWSRINKALESDGRLVPHVLKRISVGDEEREGFWLVDGMGDESPAGQERQSALVHLCEDQELGHFCDISTGQWIEDPERKLEQTGQEEEVEVSQVYRTPMAEPADQAMRGNVRRWWRGADRRNLLIGMLLVGIAAALGTHAF